MKLLVVGNIDYARPYRHLGLEETTNHMVLWEAPEDVALVVFTGGEDVDPSLYNHVRDMSTFSNPHRDQLEQSIFGRANAMGIPMSGICRGAQFLCVMAGGELVQDITSHCQRHRLKFKTDDGSWKISPEDVTSSHHQMQFPFNLPEDDYEVLAKSSETRSRHYVINGRRIEAGFASDDFRSEPDVVFYNKINALGIQYHPEWMESDSWGFKYAQKVISQYLEPLVAKVVR